MSGAETERTGIVEPGARRTRQRTAVLHALVDCRGFISAQALRALLAEVGISVGLSTVYRTLRDLERAGRVDVVRDEAGGRLYRERPEGGHRHYLICRCCGRSRVVDADVVEEWADRLSEHTGFTGVEHTLELTGVCAGCGPSAEQGEAPCRQGSPARQISARHRAEGIRTTTARP
ncbi:Fur family transcriptional regulator, ferric uptake regulator [Streptomyces sp. 2112.3]|uniref:Fur family transcriptional regulator n=1 Tax=unclassified Streptomyces TaxID=2593676 RepID=UPI0008974B82|nr:MULTISPECIES: transcriptional repressor [unclassified Streptomyces]SED85684.1 Fur family transcriptional regulator, ferric uptake regulator [Streptomyces sp. 2112.3]